MPGLQARSYRVKPGHRRGRSIGFDRTGDRASPDQLNTDAQA
jgi:hypothetical protein